MSTDTIAAIATSPGRAGISIVRVSGPDSLTIADSVFRCKEPRPSARPGGSFLYGRIYGPSEKSEIDEAILLIYRAPHSYTREDLIEIQGHGGTISAQRILRCVLDAGARAAEPGEFTRRAFLNGRVDLLQAEAVADLIAARSDRAAQAAMEQLEGSLSDSFGMLYDTILEATSDLEVSLDFPEEDDVPKSITPGVRSHIEQARKRIGELLATWGEGRILREGFKVVIVGKPNVGKSSLLNALLGEDRAIVTPIAGTTRDTVEEQTIMAGLSVRLVDTAGIRETRCEIEIEGVRRSRKAALNADLVIHVLDSSQPIIYDDVKYICENEVQGIILANKTDLGTHADYDNFSNGHLIFCSVLSPGDISRVRSAISSVLNSLYSDKSDHAVVSERHRQILMQADRDLVMAMEALAQLGEEGFLPASSHLRDAMDSLGRATGRVYNEDLLDQIFSRFCIGK